MKQLFFITFSLLQLVYSNSTLAIAETGLLTIERQYILISKHRVNRTEYDYIYKVNITNHGLAAQNITAVVTSSSVHSKIIDDSVSFNDLDVGGTSASLDTFTLRQNRRHRFNPNALSWEINSELVEVNADDFVSRVVTTNLDNPYEIIYGPDDNLWVTERTGKRVTLVNPVDGEKKTLLTIPDVFQRSGQDGLLGMVLHPNLLKNTGEDYIYLAYTYSTNGFNSGRKLKIRRYTYNKTDQKLESPFDILVGLNASNDHNAGRLVFTNDNKLFYAIGDQGANQFANKCTVNKAQVLPTLSEISNEDWSSYQGKILRLNLDGSIPSDNPVIEGVQSHIYSYGHRNPQGLVLANGLLVSAEHGPKTDDEINLISAGGNYGWPHVAGFQDDRGYEYCNWSSSEQCGSIGFSDFNCPISVQELSESSWVHDNFMPPLKSLFTVDFDFDFQNPPGGCTSAFICWPTIAPSSISYYSLTTNSIPGWNNSLFLTSLKKGEIYRVKIDSEGNLSDEIVSHWYTQNRYRDMAMDLVGDNFYIATDSSGPTSGPSGGNTRVLANPGAILEFSLLLEE